MIPEFTAGAWGERAEGAARDRAKAAFATHLVSMVTGVQAHEVLSDSRVGHVTDARAMAIYLLHVGFGMPQTRVAAAFQRDRTTVSHACRKVEKMRERSVLDRLLTRLETCLQHAPAELLS